MQTIAVVPSSDLLETCSPKQPPDPERLSEAGISQRYALLEQAWLEQTSRLNECNARLEALSEWRERVTKRFGNTREYDFGDSDDSD